MTLKQLVDRIIRNGLIDSDNKCVPDKGEFECPDIHRASSCAGCWADFLRNRYKKYKG